MTRYQAFIEIEWESMGLAQIVVTRLRDGGVADYANFLVDTFCLGVKDAFAGPEMSESELREELIERLPEDFRQPIHPACAKKLIEGAVAYAESLGFSPHRDFRKARKILSGIDAAACPRDFTYGREGRPCYIRGNNDSEERVQRVCAILEARFGAEGYDFEDPDEEGLAASILREALMDFFDREPDDIPRFYYFSGAITALLLSPAQPAPLTISDVIWGESGRKWRDPAEMQLFFDQLNDYWNLINADILDAIALDSTREGSIVDIDPEEFDDTEAGGVDLVAACMEWATGFLEVVGQYPAEWHEARHRPELQPHWDLLGWWADFPAADHRDKIAEAASAASSHTLNGAIVALARALRRPLAPGKE